jgi:hypothetical protein
MVAATAAVSNLLVITVRPTFKHPSRSYRRPDRQSANDKGVASAQIASLIIPAWPS